jgi:Tfp pilus assembly protein PilX
LLAHSSELTLPSHDEHRQRSTAWEAAEALFRPKEPAVEPATSVAPEPVEQTTRKPRVLAATPAPSQTRAPEPRVVAQPQPAAASIPPEHAARIRTWVEYGMTPQQVARLYRVEVSDVRQVLREA